MSTEKSVALVTVDCVAFVGLSTLSRAKSEKQVYRFLLHSISTMPEGGIIRVNGDVVESLAGWKSRLAFVPQEDVQS